MFRIPIESTTLLLPVALSAALTGCMPSMPTVAPVRPANMKSAVTLPLVIEFQEGDRLPLEVALNGDLVGTEPSAQPPVVVVKKHFFLVLGVGREPRISFDGKSFAPMAGSFRFGVGAEKDKAPKITLEMSTTERH